LVAIKRLDERRNIGILLPQNYQSLQHGCHRALFERRVLGGKRRAFESDFDGVGRFPGPQRSVRALLAFLQLSKPASVHCLVADFSLVVCHRGGVRAAKLVREQYARYGRLSAE
jgi:hypothetical protein